MRISRCVTLALCLAILTSACVPQMPPGVQPTLAAQPVSTGVAGRLTDANTRFAFHLFAEILKQEPEKNVFISPTSVAMALTMTYNGANGETQASMAKTLALEGQSLQEVNDANAALRTTLTNPDPKVQLRIANSLWARKGMPLKPDFLARTQSFYGAEVTHLDFASPSAPSTINDWVSKQTEGKIDKIINGVSPETILILINAIYFNGAWTNEFDKKATKQAIFHLLDGRRKVVSMMEQGGRFHYYRGQGFQAISLPYGEERLSLYIFLPGEDSSLAEFYKGLNVESWQEWMAHLSEPEQAGSIALPRFKLEYEIKLNDVLKALGMEVAFDPKRADLHGISPIAEPVWIDEVVHKTFVEVNEEGTEAAAVTAVVMGGGGAPQEEYFTMVVDRPFFCALRDNETGTLLFMGSIVEP